MTGTAESMDWTPIAAAQVSNSILLSNLRREMPRIRASDRKSFEGQAPVTVIQKYDTFLCTLSALYPKVGVIIPSKSIWQGAPGQYLQAAINSESPSDGADREEIEWLTDTASRLGHIAVGDRGHTTFQMAGFAHVASLGSSITRSDQIFVAMWFGDQIVRKAYDEAIRPAIEAAGYIPVRIDDTEHNEKIDDRIIAEIRKSKALVADLTCGLSNPIGDWSRSTNVGSPRGGVFYEAGFASGFGLPVIWSVCADVAEVENVVHFDVRQFNQIRWGTDLNDFSQRLRYRIEATLGRGNAFLGT